MIARRLVGSQVELVGVNRPSDGSKVVILPTPLVENLGKGTRPYNSGLNKYY